MKSLLIIMESMNGGGAEKVLLDLLCAIDRDRYDITLLLVFRTGALLDRLPAWLKTIYLYPAPPKGIRRVIEHFIPGRNFLYRRDVRRLMKGRHFDIAVSFLEGPALRIHNCLPDIADRNVTWNHTNLKVAHWTDYLYSSVGKEAADYRMMDNIVFVSEGARRDFSDMFGISGVHLKVVPNIIDTPAILKRSVESVTREKAFTMVAVGRLVEVKRYDRMLEAARILSEEGRDFRLWILGTGPLEKPLKEITLKLGIEDKVSFLGFQPNPYPYIKAADIMLMASDTEGYGMAMIEAQTLGTPVVATACTGASAIVTENTGILTGFSPQEMAEAVSTLMDNRELLARMSANATEKARKFDKSAVLSQIYKILDS